MIFPVVMYDVRSGQQKRLSSEALMPLNCCAEKLLRVPWAARRSNQSILKKINPEYSLEGLMLKPQYFGHLMLRADLLERTRFWERMRAGGEVDDRGRDGYMASPTQRT